MKYIFATSNCAIYGRNTHNDHATAIRAYTIPVSRLLLPPPPTPPPPPAHLDLNVYLFNINVYLSSYSSGIEPRLSSIADTEWITNLEDIVIACSLYAYKVLVLYLWLKALRSTILDQHLTTFCYSNRKISQCMKLL